MSEPRIANKNLMKTIIPSPQAVLNMSHIPFPVVTQTWFPQGSGAFSYAYNPVPRFPVGVFPNTGPCLQPCGFSLVHPLFLRPVYPHQIPIQCQSSGEKKHGLETADSAPTAVKVFKIKKYPRRIRQPLHPAQVLLLEHCYEQSKYPSLKQKINLAEKTSIPFHKVKVWFQNRRSKEKRINYGRKNILDKDTTVREVYATQTTRSDLNSREKTTVDDNKSL